MGWGANRTLEYREVVLKRRSKYEDNLKNEDDLKNEENLKNNDNPKMEICNIVGGIVYYLKKLLMTPRLDSHSTTDATLEMLSAI